MTLRRILSGLAAASVLILAACTPMPSPVGAPGTPRVLAVTTIAGDVVKAVAGDLIEVDVFLPAGADPHSFEAAPRDVAQLAGADLIFASGAGLEDFLTPLLENTRPEVIFISLSEGIELLEGGDHVDEAGHTEASEADHAPESADPNTWDPHTWMDPQNVMVWVDHIEQALSEIDPDNAAGYAANAGAYRNELSSLDAWIESQVNQIPQDKRLLVSDHTSLTYFAARYGFRQVGAIIPGYTTAAEPSAQELARLEDTIRELNVKAIYVEQEGNPRLAQRVAQDTGVQIIRLYVGSLSTPDGPASTYLDLMRYNVSAIVSGLGQ